MLRPATPPSGAALFGARMMLGGAVTLTLLLLAGEAVRRFPDPVRPPDLRSALAADYRAWTWTEFGALDQAILTDILRDRRAPHQGWIESDEVWDDGPGQAPGMLEATVGPTLAIPTSAHDASVQLPVSATATGAATLVAGQPTLALVFTPTPGPVTAIAIFPTATEHPTPIRSATPHHSSPTPFLPTSVPSRTPSTTATASLTPTRTAPPSATPPVATLPPSATASLTLTLPPATGAPPSATASLTLTLPPATGAPPSATPSPAPTSVPPTSTAPSTATATNPPATATATASATLSPSPTPTEPVTCRVSYVVRSINYGTVNTASVDLDFWNEGPTTIIGWTLGWQFGNAESLYALVGGSYTQVGQAVTVTNGPTNGTIFPGGQVALGFDVLFSDPLMPAAGFTLNGSPCAVAYGPTPTPVMPSATPTVSPSPTPAGAAACAVDFSQTGGVLGSYYQVRARGAARLCPAGRLSDRRRPAHQRPAQWHRVQPDGLGALTGAMGTGELSAAWPRPARIFEPCRSRPRLADSLPGHTGDRPVIVQ